MKVSARMQPFNAVEREFAAAYQQGARFTATEQHIRQRMKEVAYHEAGHIAAQAFTGIEWSHVVRVSIIPRATTLGRVTMHRPVAESLLPDCPMPMKQSNGWMLLLQILGGRGAEKRFVGDDYVGDIVDSDSEECLEEGTDLYRAYAVAEIMRHPRMPAGRILTLAARWTKEMMELPDVWKAVEKFAHLLLEQGVIEDPDLIDSSFGGILDMWIKLPRWKRRLDPPRLHRGTGPPHPPSLQSSPAHSPPAGYAASNLMPRSHLDFCFFHKNPLNSQLPDAA